MGSGDDAQMWGGDVGPGQEKSGHNRLLGDFYRPVSFNSFNIPQAGKSNSVKITSSRIIDANFATIMRVLWAYLIYYINHIYFADLLDCGEKFGLALAGLGGGGKKQCLFSTTLALLISEEKTTSGFVSGWTHAGLHFPAPGDCHRGELVHESWSFQGVDLTRPKARFQHLGQRLWFQNCAS